MRFIIFADGCCEPINPNGVAASAIVVVDAETGEVVDQKAQVVAIGSGATNNVAELAAVAMALKWVLEHEDVTSVTIRTDSQLAVNLVNGRWKANSDKPYFPVYLKAMKALAEVRRRGTVVRVEWVARSENEAADRLTRSLALSVFNSLSDRQRLIMFARRQLAKNDIRG